MARKHRLEFPGAISPDWLAETLAMGSGVYVSKQVGLARRAGGNNGLWFRRLTRKVKR